MIHSLLIIRFLFNYVKKMKNLKLKPAACFFFFQTAQNKEIKRYTCIPNKLLSILWHSISDMTFLCECVAINSRLLIISHWCLCIYGKTLQIQFHIFIYIQSSFIYFCFFFIIIIKRISLHVCIYVYMRECIYVYFENRN